MEYVVMLDRSAGNAEVGEMWTETKVFPETATLKEIEQWVRERVNLHGNATSDPETIRANVRISTAQ